MSHACPPGECYCPDGSEPRACGHGPGGDCDTCHGCLDCDACGCDDGGGPYYPPPLPHHYDDDGYFDYYPEEY